MVLDETGNEIRPAIMVPPGRILARHIKALGWTFKWFAQVANIRPMVLLALLKSEKKIDVEIATKLFTATGMSITYWLNLQRNYDRLQRDGEHWHRMVSENGRK